MGRDWAGVDCWEGCGAVVKRDGVHVVVMLLEGCNFFHSILFFWWYVGLTDRFFRPRVYMYLPNIWTLVSVSVYLYLIYVAQRACELYTD
jgi:hypothetical protein